MVINLMHAIDRKFSLSAPFKREKCNEIENELGKKLQNKLNCTFSTNCDRTDMEKEEEIPIDFF